MFMFMFEGRYQYIGMLWVKLVALKGVIEEGHVLCTYVLCIMYVCM